MTLTTPADFVSQQAQEAYQRVQQAAENLSSGSGKDARLSSKPVRSQ